MHTYNIVHGPNALRLSYKTNDVNTSNYSHRRVSIILSENYGCLPKSTRMPYLPVLPVPAINISPNEMQR